MSHSLFTSRMSHSLFTSRIYPSRFYKQNVSFSFYKQNANELISLNHINLTYSAGCIHKIMFTTTKLLPKVFLSTSFHTNDRYGIFLMGEYLKEQMHLRNFSKVGVNSSYSILSCIKFQQPTIYVL